MKFIPATENIFSINDEEIIEKIIKNDPDVKYLDLSDLPYIINSVSMNNDLKSALVDALKINKYVKGIIFTNSGQPINGIQILAEIIINNHFLERLKFEGNIDTEFLKIILPSLMVNDQIKRLSFANLNTNISGCNALSQYIKTNNSLKRLGFTEHQIDRNNLSIILEAISENHSIQELHIYSKESQTKSYADGVDADLFKIKEYFKSKNRKISVKM